MNRRVPSSRRLIVLAAALLLLMSCRGENAPVSTATIPPAPPRPAPQPSLATVGRQPVVTTAGSPNPWENRHAVLEHIDVGDNRITVRPLLPRINVPFQVTNRGRKPHAIVIAAPHAHVEVPVLQPGQSMFVSLPLSDRHYTITCRMSGHSERGEFDTYEPGEPIHRRRQ